jgi:hypothetical protein
MIFHASSLPAGIPTWFIAREHRYTMKLHWQQVGRGLGADRGFPVCRAGFRVPNPLDEALSGPKMGSRRLTWGARTDPEPLLTGKRIPAEYLAHDSIPTAEAIPAVQFKALYPKCTAQRSYGVRFYDRASSQ